MRRRKLANGNLEVSAIGLGSMSRAGSCGAVLETQEMISLIRAIVERGVTFFDTAQPYGPFANDGLEMQAGLNEARPLGALLAQI